MRGRCMGYNKLLRRAADDVKRLAAEGHPYLQGMCLGRGIEWTILMTLSATTEP